MTMEPSDVGPKYGGHLPVTEADRADALALLDTARTRGYLSPDEYEHRALVVRSASLRDDLQPVVRDLGNLTLALSSAPAPSSPAVQAKSSLVRVGFFSGMNVKGARAKRG